MSTPRLVAIFGLWTNTVGGASGGERLRPWLEGLSVEVSAFGVLPAHLGFAVAVNGGTCRNISVGGVAVTSASGDAEVGLEASVHVSGIGLSCDVATSIEVVGISRPCAVSLTAEIRSLALDIHVLARSGLPEGKPSASCTAEGVAIRRLAFRDDSAACELLSTASGVLRRLIESHTALACGVAADDLARGLSSASQAALAMATPYLRPAAPLPTPAGVPAAALDLRRVAWEGPLGTALRSFFVEVAHTGDPATFNQFLARVLEDLSLLTSDGHLVLPDVIRKLLPLALRTSLPGSSGTILVEVSVEDVAVANVTSLSAVSASMVAAAAGRVTGAVAPSGSARLAVTVSLPQDGQASVELLGYKINLTEAAPLAGVELVIAGEGHIEGALGLFAAFDTVGLGSLQLDQMQRLGCSDRLLSRGIAGGPVQALELRAKVSAHNVEASLPELSSTDLESQLTVAALRGFGAAWATFGDTAATVMDGWVSGPGRAAANGFLKNFTAAARECPASNFSSGCIESVAEPTRWIAVASFSLCAGLAAFAVASLALKAAGWKRCKRRPSSSEGTAVLDVAAPLACLENSLRQSALLVGVSEGDSPQALAWSAKVSPALRWGMIFAIIGTIFLFIVATVTPGVAITVSFTGAGETWATPDIAHLSLDNTVVDMVRSEAYFLAVVVIMFSLFWPYAKLLAMMYAWLVPMRQGDRRQLLVFLDQAGKWSLTDNFAMFLLVVLFWVRWDGNDVTAAQPAAASFGLTCTPGAELNLFVAATVLSLLLGHSMLAVHRWQQFDFCIIPGGLSEPLWRKATWRGKPISRAAAAWVALFIGAAGLLLVASWFGDIIEIRLGGLAGAFNDVTGRPQAIRYSLLGVVQRLETQGSAYLQAVMATFVVAIPALSLLAAMLLWIVPLPPRSQLALFTLCQALSAWSSLDAFIVAYLGTVLGGEKYGIAHFIDTVIYHQNIGPICGGLRTVGVECISLHLNMLPPVALLIVGAAAAAAAGYLVRRRAEGALSCKGVAWAEAESVSTAA